MPGTFGRVAIGLIVFINVIAYNETGAVTVLFSTVIATVCATFSGKKSLYRTLFFQFRDYNSLSMMKSLRTDFKSDITICSFAWNSRDDLQNFWQVLPFAKMEANNLLFIQSCFDSKKN